MTLPTAGRPRRGTAQLLTPADRRGLTLLFWQHVRSCGEVRLNLNARLNLGRLPAQP
ncbi:hypothetical protein [Nonomuraea pusilla]|uniref:hypothetical protein n=1 Tax=Nonomuraea pusilla TaxID=46177 RepID=UPI000B117838|nr:hypothetical protein [Nonomuraea pusilla]